MLQKAIRIMAGVLLVLLPFAPLLGNFAPFMGGTLGGYLIACTVQALVLWFLAWIWSRGRGRNNPELLQAAWLLWLLGVLVAPPLHLGPPVADERLLVFAVQEQVRYGMLLLACLVFSAGCLAANRVYRSRGGRMGAVVWMLLLLCLPLVLWDNYDSFRFSARLEAWVHTGRAAGDFFSDYDYQESLRAAGRILLYVLAAWLALVLTGRGVIRKAAGWATGLFSLLGIAGCVAFLLAGPQFYFPFMVPAIAMAPAYWLGIALLYPAPLRLPGR